MPEQIRLRSSYTPLPDQTHPMKKAKHAAPANTTPANQYIVVRQYDAAIYRFVKNIRDSLC